MAVHGRFFRRLRPEFQKLPAPRAMLRALSPAHVLRLRHVFDVEISSSGPIGVRESDKQAAAGRFTTGERAGSTTSCTIASHSSERSTSFSRTGVTRDFRAPSDRHGMYRMLHFGFRRCGIDIDRHSAHRGSFDIDTVDILDIVTFWGREQPAPRKRGDRPPSASQAA